MVWASGEDFFICSEIGKAGDDTLSLPTITGYPSPWSLGESATKASQGDMSFGGGATRRETECGCNVRGDT